MALQNMINTQQPTIFASGTHTFTFQITAAENATGWGKITNKVATLIQPNTGASSDVTNSLKMTNRFSDGKMVEYFREFWQSNPFYVRGINIRLDQAAYMPSAIRFVTPNIFTGEMSAVICETAPLISSGQYNKDILNLSTNVMIGRNTVIEIDGTPAAGIVLNMDLIISVYASLEEALQSFVTSDNTIE